MVAFKRWWFKTSTTGKINKKEPLCKAQLIKHFLDINGYTKRAEQRFKNDMQLNQLRRDGLQLIGLKM